jgi:hypothetical protein
MHTLFSLYFVLPTFYTLQMMSLGGPLHGPTRPAVRDTFHSDRE